MPVGASETTAAGYLSAVFQAQAFVVSALWAKKHVGDPGAAGTASPAGDTTRVDVSACFSTDPALVGGLEQIANDAELGPWTDVTTAETYSHLSFWTDPVAGIFVGSGTVTAAAVAVHDDWSVPVGDCVIKTPVAT